MIMAKVPARLKLLVKVVSPVYWYGGRGVPIGRESIGGGGGGSIGGGGGRTGERKLHVPTPTTDARQTNKG